MIGVPKHLNTKEDVLYVYTLALQGQLPKDEVKRKIENLLSDEKIWVYKAEVESDYTPSETEKVMLQQETDGEKHICFELQDNPNARFLQMGFTKEEILNLIKNLEEV